MIDNVRDTRCHPTLCGHLAIRVLKEAAFTTRMYQYNVKQVMRVMSPMYLESRFFCLIILHWLDSAFIMRFMANSVGYLAFHISSSSPPSLS